MDRIRELLGRLAELTAEELTELDGLLAAEADRLAGEDRTDENVAALGEVADATERVAAENDARVAAEAEREQTAQAALDRIAAARADRVAAPDPDADADPDSGSAGDGDSGEGETQDGSTPSGDRQPEAVAASGARPAGRRAPIGAVNRARGGATTRDRSPGGSAAGGAGPQPAALVAAGSGETITDVYDLANRINRRHASFGAGGSSGPAEQIPVATVQYQFPEERRLLHDSVGTNTRRLDAVTAPEAVVAAGGLCAPLERLYDIEVLGTTARPVRDALPSFQADRGGVEWRVPPTLSALTNSAGLWTMQNDIDASTAGAPDPTKAIIDVVCPTTDSATVEAITSRLRFKNIAARFDPEGTAANIRLAAVVQARLAENTLLAKLNAKSTRRTAAKVLGATRDLFALFQHLAPEVRNVYRIEEDVALQAIMPGWVGNLVATDFARAVHNSRSQEQMREAADGRRFLTELLGELNVRPVYHLDGLAAVVGPPAIAQQFYTAGAADSVVTPFPDTASINLFPAGAFTLLDGGTLDLGVVRDSSLNSRNEYELFSEIFEGIAYRGPFAIQAIATLQPSGESSGTAAAGAIVD